MNYFCYGPVLTTGNLSHPWLLINPDINKLNLAAEAGSCHVIALKLSAEMEIRRCDDGFFHKRLRTLLEAMEDERIAIDSEKYSSVQTLGAYSSVGLMIGTWNVGGNRELTESALAEWLPLRSNRFGSDMSFDVIVIALQEIIPLTASNVVGGGNLTVEGSIFWQELVLRYLNSNGADIYHVVATESMVGLWMGIFAMRPFIDAHISDIARGTVATGVGGVLGNKGGISIRMKIHDSTVCFVNAYLTAHRENVGKRNDDYAAILSAKAFRFDDPFLSRKLEGKKAPSMVRLEASLDSIDKKLKSMKFTNSNAESSARDDLLDSGYSIDDHDVIFWAGDLNYRICESCSTESVFDMIMNQQIVELSMHDQLSIERDEERAFVGFYEGMLNFPPTYKYLVGHPDLYDQRMDSGARCPAWCDRVLWRIGKANDGTHIPMYSAKQSDAQHWFLRNANFACDCVVR